MTFSNDELRDMEKLLHMALLHEPIFSSQIFHTLTGTSSEDVSLVVEQSESFNLDDRNMRRLVFDVLSNLSNFPHRQDERILSDVGLTRSDIRNLRQRIRELGV